MCSSMLCFLAKAYQHGSQGLKTGSLAFTADNFNAATMLNAAPESKAALRNKGEAPKGNAV